MQDFLFVCFALQAQDFCLAALNIRASHVCAPRPLGQLGLPVCVVSVCALVCALVCYYCQLPCTSMSDCMCAAYAMQPTRFVRLVSSRDPAIFCVRELE
jgi:hypothetical protein